MLEHNTGRHPEQVARLKRIQDGFAKLSNPDITLVNQAHVDPSAVLSAVHSQEQLDAVAKLARSGGGFIDADTVVSSGSLDAAMAAAALSCSAVDDVIKGKHRNAF